MEEEYPITGSRYQIIQYKSNMCLDSAGDDKGAHVFVEPQHGSYNQYYQHQLWELLPSTHNGYYQIKQKHSNMCLDSAGDDKGARVFVEPQHGPHNQYYQHQLWTFIKSSF